MNYARLILCSIFLTACTESEQPKSIPFKPTGDVKHLMQWVLDPAADRIWDSAGTIITAEGARELAPTTEEGWLAVQHSAVVVAETGNLLLMPGQAMDDGDWQDISLGLVDAGLAARSAAEAHDADALFEAGAEIYRVCVSCHSVYVQGNEI